MRMGSGCHATACYCLASAGAAAASCGGIVIEIVMVNHKPQAGGKMED